MTARPAIEHADARDWLAGWRPGCAKFAVFDPPYAVGSPVRGREDGAAGSVFAPFENLHRWLLLTANVLAPGGVAMIFADWRRMSDLGYLCSMSGLRQATCVAWIRNRPGTGGLLRAAWDPVLIVSRGVPDAVDRAAIPNWVEANYPNPRRHPYEKPQQVYRHVMARVCRPGDLVLDPFAGAGGSGEVAAELGLDWHGCDIDPVYADSCDRPGCCGNARRAS